MVRVIGSLLVAGAVLTAGGCTMLQPKTPEQRAGTALFFDYTSEADRERLQMFVHPEFVRLDFNPSGRAVIFQRDKKRLYDIDFQAKTVHEVKGEAPMVDMSGIDIEIEEADSHVSQTRQAKHYVIKVNGEACYNMVAVEEILPDVVEAWKEMLRVMANDSRLAKLDPGSCEYVMKVAQPELALNQGFPVRQWASGFNYQVFMTRYQIRVVPPEDIDLQALPDWY